MRGFLHRFVELIKSKCVAHVAPLVSVPTDKKEIVRFEECHQIKLPVSYADILTSRRLMSPFDSLSEWCQPNDEEEMQPGFLASPFPHVDAWNDLSLFSDEKGWGSSYFDDHWWQGAMRVSNLGCEGYTLLVISGSCRGQLWCDLRVPEMKGIFPLKNRRGERLTVEKAWRGFNLLIGRKADVFSPSKYFARFSQTESK